jgi:O-antigen biosynthesis rhamnosyltransferase
MTSPLRILVVTPLPPSITGGIEEYAYSVIGSLRARGDHVTVLTTHYGDIPARDNRSLDVTYLASKELWGRPVCFRIAAYLRIVSLVRRADVVHIHMPFPFVETIAASLAKVMGKPLLVTYHMDAVVDTGRSGPKPIHYLAEGLYRAVSAIPTVDMAERVCTNTKAYAVSSRVLSRRLDRVLVVHQGIDASKVADLSREKAAEVRRQLLGDRYSEIVCFVGRLVPYKGLDVLLDSVRSLNRSKTLFVIGGRGPEEPHLRRSIEEHHLTNVRLVGFVPDHDLMNLLYAADLVVSPSVSMLESTPITLLYARAAGTAVVASDIGGSGESIPNDGVAGIIVPASDPAALGEAIRTLLDSRPGHHPDPSPRFWSDVAEDYSRMVRQLYGGGRDSPLGLSDSRPITLGGPSDTVGGK